MTSEALKPILSEPVEWDCGDPDVAAYRIAKKIDSPSPVDKLASPRPTA
jgi:hypothetical protein